MKIDAIDHGRNVVTKIDELFAPLYLFLFVAGAKRDVMNRPGRHTPNAEDLVIAREAIAEAARGIRQRQFEATPDYQACRYCPYNQICPSTATQE